jgi:hypothetical protein
MSGFWQMWLVVWALGVVLFGLVLAGGAFESTSAPVVWVLESLQGPGEVVLDPTLRFSLAVMGCVSIGWAAMMLAVMRVAFRMADRAGPLWSAVTLGVVVWFITDSALSAATGFGLNIVPNLALLATYLIGVVAGGAFRKPAAATE